MPKTNLSVLIADDHLTRLHEVVHRLKDAGFVVDRVMDSIGTVSGSIDSASFDALSRIEGVAAVERSHDYQLPPPDSDVQ